MYSMPFQGHKNSSTNQSQYAEGELEVAETRLMGVRGWEVGVQNANGDSGEQESHDKRYWREKNA